MSSKFITKRPHKKSRAGCITCKSRKIKCDEAQPKCSFCNTRAIPCNYPTTSSNQSSRSPTSISTSSELVSSSPWKEDVEEESVVSPLCIASLAPVMPVEFSQTDLRMMHHWSTSTWSTVGIRKTPMQKVLQFIVPELAFENNFLMNGMLGVASLDMQRLLPDPTTVRRQTVIYRAKALQQYRQALPFVHMNSENYNAALLMAILLVVLCSQDHPTSNDELTIVRWIILYGGLRTVMKMGTFETVMSSKVGPIFRRYITEVKSTPVVPVSLLNMVACITPMDAEYASLKFYFQTLDDLAVVYASLGQDGVSNAFAIRVITWPTYVTEEFTQLAKETRPRALIILAHYLVFTKLVPDLWWMEGIADREIMIIARMISPEWLPFLDIPLQAVSLTKIEDIVSLILGQFNCNLNPGRYGVPSSLCIESI